MRTFAMIHRQVFGLHTSAFVAYSDPPTSLTLQERVRDAAYQVACTTNEVAQIMPLVTGLHAIVLIDYAHRLRHNVSPGQIKRYLSTYVQKDDPKIDFEVAFVSHQDTLAIFADFLAELRRHHSHEVDEDSVYGTDFLHELAIDERLRSATFGLARLP